MEEQSDLIHEDEKAAILAGLDHAFDEVPHQKPWEKEKPAPAAAPAPDRER